MCLCCSRCCPPSSPPAQRSSPPPGSMKMVDLGDNAEFVPTDVNVTPRVRELLQKRADKSVTLHLTILGQIDDLVTKVYRSVFIFLDVAAVPQSPIVRVFVELPTERNKQFSAIFLKLKANKAKSPKESERIKAGLLLTRGSFFIQYPEPIPEGVQLVPVLYGNDGYTVRVLSSKRCGVLDADGNEETEKVFSLDERCSVDGNSVFCMIVNANDDFTVGVGLPGKTLIVEGVPETYGQTTLKRQKKALEKFEKQRQAKMPEFEKPNPEPDQVAEALKAEKPELKEEEPNPESDKAEALKKKKEERRAFKRKSKMLDDKVREIALQEAAKPKEKENPVPSPKTRAHNSWDLSPRPDKFEKEKARTQSLDDFRLAWSMQQPGSPPPDRLPDDLIGVGEDAEEE